MSEKERGDVDRQRKADERIEVLLLEGLDSGKPLPVTLEYWESKKRKLAERRDRLPFSACDKHE